MTAAGAPQLDDLGRVEAARGTRVTAVEPLLLTHTFASKDEQAWSGGRLPGVTAGLVRVRTDSGLHGIGETYAGFFAPEVVRAVIEYHADAVVGQDPSDVVGISNRCRSRTLYWGRSGVAIAVLSAIEAALWDICGKLTAKPAWELLGGAGRAPIARYASGGMEADEVGLEREAAAVRREEFGGMKIRTGVAADADHAKARRVRSALNAEIDLAIDAVQGSNPNPWTAAQAIKVGHRLEELAPLWFEEPCFSMDVEGYAQCRRALRIPIAGGESSTTLEEVERFLHAGALDILQPDAAWLGGLLPTVRAGAMAADRDVRVAMHAWGCAGSVMANYHAAFAMSNCDWLEYPTTPNPLLEALLVEPLQVIDGMVFPPRAPGLGIDVSPDVEARFPYRPGNHYLFEERR